MIPVLTTMILLYVDNKDAERYAHMCSLLTLEPLHEISNTVVCSTSKAQDQPAHMRSMIRAFASRLNMSVKGDSNPNDKYVLSERAL